MQIFRVEKRTGDMEVLFAFIRSNSFLKSKEVNKK